jgi:hypothetical protein
MIYFIALDLCAMSSEEPRPYSRYAPITLTEYIQAQKEAGSCKDSFISDVSKLTKFGVIVGIPIGLSSGYR